MQSSGLPPGRASTPRRTQPEIGLRGRGAFQCGAKSANSLRKFSVRARSSTGQSIGLRIRPSPVMQRDIAGSEETENPCARRVFCTLPIPLILSESLEIDATPVATAQHMPNYFGLGKAEYFSKVRCSAAAVAVGQKLGTGRRRASSINARATETHSCPRTYGSPSNEALTASTRGANSWRANVRLTQGSRAGQAEEWRLERAPEGPGGGLELPRCERC